jgi:ribulose-5-phosphate 4-epimerase/fuculose-1-phosphate aldolase
VSEARLRAELVRVGRELAGRGLSPGNSGNLSVRLGDGYLATPTNSALGALDADRLSQLARDGRHLGGDPPTKEVPLHLAVYEQRPDAQAIVHLHSSCAVAVSCLAEVDPEDVLPPLTPYYVMRVGRLPLIPYARPGDAALADRVRECARESGAVLLANHGPLVAGSSLAAAAATAEELEEAARVFLMLRGLPVRALTAEQVAELRQPRD